MRTLDGRILVDLGDNDLSQMTGSVEVLVTSSINENETAYNLLPERINAVPYISTSIYNTSTPQIKPIQFNDPDKYNMFIDDQGVIKVAVGSSFILRLKAMQPPIYNIENGVPTEYSDQTLLTYQWQKDGVDLITDTDNSRPNSTIQVKGTFNEELHFENISANFAGTYLCIVSNDIGSVESEQVVIEVYNPDIEDAFYTNLINNPYGKGGTEGWNSPDMEFVTNRFSNTSFEKFSQPWNTDLFGYSVDMLYPRPYQINTHHIKNSNFEQDIMQEGYYFTRERFKYRVKDGKSLINASYDVDVSNIKEYIQGSIYGVKGVRAIFGCYIGNAISKFKTTLLTALITRRSAKFSLLPSKSRLDIANVLLAGIPNKLEEIKVIVQEMDDETPLLSSVNGNMIPGIVMYDPWTKAIWNTQGSNIAAGIPNAVNVPTNTTEAKIVDIIQNNRLFPSQDVVPTYGQYAEFNRQVIDQLNFRTNKIRISISFETFANVVSITDRNHVEASDECFEHEPWDWITKPMHWPLTEDDFAKDPQSGNVIGLDWYNQKVLNIKDASEVFRYATLLGSPRAMSTGYNLVLIPLEQNFPAKSDYYTRTLLSTTNNLYPRLSIGTSVTSPVGTYLGTLSDYDYEIIGVNIENRYNLPFYQNSEYNVADGEVASRTSITTYKYNKSHSVEFPNVLNFGTWKNATNTYDTSGTIWRTERLTTSTDFLPVMNEPPLEYVIVYNSTPNDDLASFNIEQVIGNIQSNIIKYTNNLITDVPVSFVTQSVQKRDYFFQGGIGFQLNLLGEDYGIPTTESQQPLMASGTLKQELIKDWRTINNTGSYNYYYKVLDNISQQNTMATNATQHIVYSKGYDVSRLGTNASVLRLTSSFTFTTASFYERPGTYRGESGTAGTVGYQFDTRVTIAKQQAESKWNIDKQLRLNVSVAGQQRTLKYIDSTTTVEEDILSWLGTVISSSAGTTALYNAVMSTGGGTQVSTGKQIVYTMYAKGTTQDRVKLFSAKGSGISTPAAIVIPSKKKIYYFIYNYTDNVLRES